MERGLGIVLTRFDHFFGDDRRLDLESPSSRLRLKGWARSAKDKPLVSSLSAAAALRLPQLESMLGNARLVVSGESASAGAQPPPQGTSDPGVDPTPPAPPPEAAPVAGEAIRNSSGAAELRGDVVRHGPLVVDSSAGLRFTWPPIPYGKLRGHLVLPLGAGLIFRATETLIVEMGPRGFGSLTDLELERLFWEQLRLRLEGHALINQLTRGEEWAAQFSVQWKVHRRTGLITGVGVAGYGTPSPAVELERVFVGVRQDVWHDWIFLELEPEIYVPHIPGQPRQQVPAVTLRVEVALDARPAPGEATP